MTVHIQPLIHILHRTLGWCIAVLVIWIAFTGILLALGEQIERIAEPQLFSVQPTSQPLASADFIRDSLQQQYGSQLSIAPHTSPFDPYIVEVDAGSANARVLWVDPYTGKVRAERRSDERLLSTLKRLHLFFIPPVAWATSLGLLLMVVTGILQTRRHTISRVRWHRGVMLMVAPLVLWQALTGLGLASSIATGTLLALHNPLHLTLRLLFVVGMIGLIAGVVLACVARVKSTR